MKRKLPDKRIKKSLTIRLFRMKIQLELRQKKTGRRTNGNSIRITKTLWRMGLFWLLKKVGFIVIFLGIWITCITIMIRNHRKNQAIKRYFNNHHQEAGWRMAMSGNNYANPHSVAHNNTRMSDALL